jgi:hypothetical protein
MIPALMPFQRLRELSDKGTVWTVEIAGRLASLGRGFRKGETALFDHEHTSFSGQ